MGRVAQIQSNNVPATQTSLITKKECQKCELCVVCIFYDAFTSHPNLVSLIFRDGCPGSDLKR